MENLLVPEQTLGSEMDALAAQLCESEAAAIVFYQVCKKRLFDVNNWAQFCGTNATEFQLTDLQGNPISTIEEGVLIRIDIPGPGTQAGDGYDWVKVEQIAQQGESELTEWAGFRVRPCANPQHPELGTAHFFSDRATSTFMVKRAANEVVAEMHGRNEVKNEESEGVFDGLRNAMVGYSARIGLSYPQWKLLVDGLVAKDQ
jgi:hypothetical protein